MYIKKKRIRSLASNIHGVAKGQKVIVAIAASEIHIDQLLEIGFSKALEVGEKVLPSPIGTVTSHNAQGNYVPDKTKPMETVYRQAEWSWQEFRGRYETEECSKIVEIPYQRYPRIFYKPPSIELEVSHTTNGKKIIISPTFSFDKNNPTLLHTINLFLECFGECEILNDKLGTIFHAAVKRLNWEVLPAGTYPWKKLEPLVRPVVQQLPKGNQVVINKRLETINEHSPEFVAIGKAGFAGYLVFGFPSLNIFLLESTAVNNATYILDKDWKEISSLTKAEILREELHKDRIIHRENWFRQIHSTLRKSVA